MRIKKIDWLDEESLEACVVITDGHFECVAFSHPCKLSVNDKVNEPLHSFEEAAVYRTKQKITSARKHDGEDNWSHDLVCQVVNKAQNLVKVGEIQIILNSLPGDILDGDFVECSPSRLDLYT